MNYLTANLHMRCFRSKAHFRRAAATMQLRRSNLIERNRIQQRETNLKWKSNVNGPPEPEEALSRVTHLHKSL